MGKKHQDSISVQKSKPESNFKRAVGAIKCPGFRKGLYDAYASLRSMHGELLQIALQQEGLPYETAA